MPDNSYFVLGNLADFASKKKDIIFLNISGDENIEEKKMSDFCTAHFDFIDVFSFHIFLALFMGNKEKDDLCYFLDFQKFLQKRGKKEYCGHFGHLTDFVSD